MKATSHRILFTLFALGCATVTDPPSGTGEGKFEIALAQPEFTQREAAEFGIRATVRNLSGQDFFARVGDAFNAALEQQSIFAGVGTHAVIERRVSDSQWQNANTGVLVEGSRFVVMRAGKSYQLTGSIAPNSPGTYRIRLDYTSLNDDPAAVLPFRDYSPTFLVR
jgi:hypothetical protein